ncbi:hypothetical protein H2200_003753 [Cladophialophora chaetospira]|uniref:MARVEL domain-containing protein n=1 Tax=Cladophialophora chaetospira TaxID=386627 RepID=A0AA39CLC0_9EURO|nr:hypothetical protein H2200_003753 [Cladophialophora chaetospira]
MLSSGAVTTTVIFQLVIGFIAVLLAAFSTACFGPEFAYGVVWWSLGWNLVTACLRLFTRGLHRSVAEQIVHLGFEIFALVNWLVATGVLIALNIHLNKLKKDYDFDVHNNIQLTDVLLTHQFTALGIGGLYCSYALNAVTGIVFCLFLLSTSDSIRFLIRSRRAPEGEVEKEYKYDNVNVSTQEQLVHKTSTRTI